MGLVISFVIGIVLMIFMLKLKKDDPFPKGTVGKLIIAGIISCVVSVAVSIILSLLVFIMRAGSDGLIELVELAKAGDQTGLKSFMDGLIAEHIIPLPLYVFIKTLITIGIVEEVSKYIFIKSVIKKEGVVRTWMDIVIGFGLGGLSFEIFENILYTAKSGPLLGIIRGLTPGHLCVGVIMGFYLGKYYYNMQKINRILMITIPVLVHTIFDTALNWMTDDIPVALQMCGPLAVVLMLLLAVIIIVKLLRWHKKGTLDMEIRIG